jgi:hypothetical protein
MHIVISNQWGDNLPGFIQVAEKLGYDITANNRNDDSLDNSEDLIKLNYFKLETPFPESIAIIKISVANSNEKMWQDLGEQITVHYDVINNAIVKHNSYEDEPVYEYLDVWEAEIPETYLDLEEWLGEIYFTGEINGLEWSVRYHGGYIEDRMNINQELEWVLFQNFSEKKMYYFIEEILVLLTK